MKILTNIFDLPSIIILGSFVVFGVLDLISRFNL